MRTAVAQIVEDPKFRTFLRKKVLTLWTVVVLFLVFYMLLPIFAGYAKPLMAKYVLGFVTFGYAFGLLYYLVAWGLAFVYVVLARSFDRDARAFAEKATNGAAETASALPRTLGARSAEAVR
ncbi:MAG: DUF485 domain-containing protein [Brockia lithotrophica]|nr:DUF485 domain-containing protein [Brockia lithotrophica]